MDQSFERRDYRVYLLPQRYIIALLTAFASFVGNLINTSHKVTYEFMLAPLKPETSLNSSHQCRFNESNTSETPFTGERYSWSSGTRTNLVTSYYTGNFLGFVLGGLLSHRYGGKPVLGFAILTASTFELLTPVAIQSSQGSFFMMAVFRFINGCAAGMIFPSIHGVIANWSPQRDLGRLSCIMFSATQFSLLINDQFTYAMMLKTRTWTVVYYVYGGLGVLFCILWCFFGYSHYSESPLLSSKEFDYLEKEMVGRITLGPKPIPWRKMATSAPLWVLAFISFGHFWIWIIMISYLPTYMKEVLKYDNMRSQVAASVPFAVLGCSTVAIGFFSDFIINGKYVDLTAARKMFTTIGNMGPVIFSLAAIYAGCRRELVTSTFAFGLSTMCGYYVGTRINTLDLAPNYSSIIMPITSAAIAIPAISLPTIIAVFTKNKTFDEWANLFWVFLILFMMANVLFVIFGSGHVQPWNNPTRERKVVLEKESRTGNAAGEGPSNTTDLE